MAGARTPFDGRLTGMSGARTIMQTMTQFIIILAAALLLLAIAVIPVIAGA